MIFAFQCHLLYSLQCIHLHARIHNISAYVFMRERDLILYVIMYNKNSTGAQSHYYTYEYLYCIAKTHFNKLNI